MSKFKELAGKRFGRLVAIERKYRQTPSGRKALYFCQCDCGNTSEVMTQSLKDGRTTSCGCFRREESRKNNTKHGYWGTPTYKTWLNIKKKCMNPNSDGYHLVGAKGIKLCRPWQKSFQSFLNDMGERPEGAKLRRMNTEGHYKPSNCYWQQQPKWML